MNKTGLLLLLAFSSAGMLPASYGQKPVRQRPNIMYLDGIKKGVGKE